MTGVCASDSGEWHCGVAGARSREMSSPEEEKSEWAETQGGPGRGREGPCSGPGWRAGDGPAWLEWGGGAGDPRHCWLHSQNTVKAFLPTEK